MQQASGQRARANSRISRESVRAVAKSHLYGFAQNTALSAPEAARSNAHRVLSAPVQYGRPPPGSTRKCEMRISRSEVRNKIYPVFGHSAPAPYGEHVCLVWASVAPRSRRFGLLCVRKCRFCRLATKTVYLRAWARYARSERTDRTPPRWAAQRARRRRQGTRARGDTSDSVCAKFFWISPLRNSARAWRTAMGLAAYHLLRLWMLPTRALAPHHAPNSKSDTLMRSTQSTA